MSAKSSQRKPMPFLLQVLLYLAITIAGFIATNTTIDILSHQLATCAALRAEEPV